MRLPLSILVSAALQLGVVAAALLGSWPQESITLAHFSQRDDTARAVSLRLPSPEPPSTPLLLLDKPEASSTREPPREPKTSDLAQPEADPSPAELPAAVPSPAPVKPPAEPAPEPEPEPEPPAPPIRALVASPSELAPSGELASAALSQPGSTKEDVAGAVAPDASRPGRAAAPASAPGGAPMAGRGEGIASTSPRGEVNRAGILKDYKKLLFKTIDDAKTVPRAVRRARLEGTVYLRVTLDAEGRILDVSVRKSSGHEALDQGAVDALKALKTLPAPPEALGWKKKSLTIPIRYKIK